MILQIYYVLLQMAEALVGMWILNNLYPELRKNSRWLRGISILSCIILSMVYAGNAWDSFVSTLFILLFAIFLSLIYCCCFKVGFLKCFLFGALYLVSVAFLKLPALILECIVSGESVSEINRGSRTMVECIWCTILILGIAYAAGRKEFFDYYKKSVKRLVHRDTGLVLAITGILWFLLGYGMRIGKTRFYALDFIYSIVLIFGIFLCLHYLILRMAHHEVQLDKNYLENSLEMLRKRNREIHEMDKKNREHLHEHYHTLEYLYYCIKKSEYGRAEEFLGDKLSELKRGTPKVWTGLPFLDFIINCRKQTMDETGIVFRLELDVHEYPFEESELGILLGNLLDNAIEACEKCKPGEREIYLKIWNLRRMFLLKLINSSSKIPERREQRFITDKADKYAHGMGVEQIRRIVEKYGGDISFQYSEERFETKIMVSNVKEEKG